MTSRNILTYVHAIVLDAFSKSVFGALSVRVIAEQHICKQPHSLMELEETRHTLSMQSKTTFETDLSFLSQFWTFDQEAGPSF